MRRVPSVNPEELRTLSELLAKHRGGGVLNHSFDVPLCVRYLESRRYGIGYTRLLPEFIQKSILRFAATRPLESDLPEILEEAIKGWKRVDDLQNPTQPVIL
jgi:hypothetical protein